MSVFITLKAIGILFCLLQGLILYFQNGKMKFFALILLDPRGSYKCLLTVR